MTRSLRRLLGPSGPRPAALCASGALLLCWCAAGCDGPTAPDGDIPDASADGAPDGGFELEIDPPTPPSLTPCPEGWREVEVAESQLVCEPWPETGPLECPIGQAHFPGEPSCSSIGAECPSGEWSDDLPTDGTVLLFVSAGATAGGDGSRDRPFATIAAALAEAGDGDVVAVGRGTYDEPVVLRAGETLWGACAAETTITTSWTSASAGVVTVVGDGASLRDLRISGDRSGVWISGPYTLEMQGVDIDGVERIGLLARSGGAATLRDVVVRGTRPVAGEGYEGRGLAVETGAEVSMIRGVVAESHVVGVAVVGEGAVFEAEDVAIVRTLSEASSGGRGLGLYLEGGARARCAATVIEHCRMAGVYATGEGTELTLESSVIRDVLARESDRDLGTGLQVQEGVTAELDHVLIERATGAGITAVTEGTSVTARDLVVVDTRISDLDQRWGYGAVAQAGALIDVQQALFAGNHQSGVTATRPGAFVRLEDVVVRDTRSVPGGTEPLRGGRGLEAIFDGHLEVVRGLILDNHEVGVTAIGEAVEVTLTDVRVVGTLPAECESGPCEGAGGGIGIGAYGGAHVDVSRFEVDDAALAGLQLAGSGRPGGSGAIDAREGRVARCAVGANVQSADYDLTRLTDRVVFVDNGRDLDSAALPVPPPASPFGD